jgi:Zn-dependent protease with chaperone function
MTDRVTLSQISSRAWEHPADRAALNTLRALPGFDEVVRKVAGFLGERGIRLLFLANAVKVGPRQRPDLDALYSEVLQTLDCPRRPELYVTQTPVLNAMAVGFDEPFIVINSGALTVLDREETRFILAHEVGHIMSGHTTYRTLAIIILTFGVKYLPFLAGLALMPFELALLEWYRKAELSSDRAGLLGIQNERDAMRTFMKMAGGDPEKDTADLDAFMEQAREYELDNNAWDTILKIIATAFRDHPFATLRAAELQRWVASGEYGRIIAGDYPRRGADGDRPLSDDYVDAAGYYGDQARGAMSSIGGMFDRARGAFSEAFRGPTK